MSDKEQSFVKSYFKGTEKKKKKVKQTAVFVTKPKWHVRAVVTVFPIMKYYLFCEVLYLSMQFKKIKDSFTRLFFSVKN